MFVSAGLDTRRKLQNSENYTLSSVAQFFSRGILKRNVHDKYCFQSPRTRSSSRSPICTVHCIRKQTREPSRRATRMSEHYEHKQNKNLSFIKVRFF